MTRKSKQLSQLRTKAEARLGPAPEASATDAEHQLHELRVHQIELELQNEELQQSRATLEISHSRYRDLYELAPVGYLALTVEGQIIEINLTATTLLGIVRNKLLNHYFSKLISEKDGDRWYLLLHKKPRQSDRQSNQKKNIELQLKRGLVNPCYFDARLDCLWVMTENKTLELRITLTDISESKRTEEELRIAAITFDAQEGIMITDANEIILRVNKAYTDITGYLAEELLGQPLIFKSERHSASFYEKLWECVAQTGSWQGEIWDQRKNGDVYPRWTTITAVKNNEGIISNYVILLTDISEHKASEEEIKRLAYYDPLTALPNRRLLLDRLQQALATSSRSEKYGALLFIDLDNFKSLNDDLGHDMGDVLLQQVAQRLISCVREGDTVSRQGGDEFVVMLEELSDTAEEAAAKAKTIGEKILVSLNQAYQLTNQQYQNQEYQNTPSIGVTLFINHQQSINALLKRADIAMYGAKSAGRNTLCFFDQDMQKAITIRAALETDLRLALRKNQFQLYFQPQVQHNGKIIAAEVLLRWQHPQRGLVSPLEFIPLAEDIGLIVPLGSWVLETVCALLKRWGNYPQTRNLQLAVNISARQFHQADFVEQMCAMLDKWTINADRLKLEFTESLVFDDIEDSLTKMQSLKEIGVSFAMDDFGTGYSSLSYLTQLPFDQLKIDQSFVRNIGIKPSGSMVVQTIIGMAKNLKVDIIAEGVETEEQRAFLERNGCPTYQGNLTGTAMILSEFEHKLGLGDSQ